MSPKTILIVIHGKSVEELERRITDFKDLNVHWGSMSTFHIPQKYILDKINKKFDIVFDSSTVKNEIEYETRLRLPRLRKYFDTTDGKYICTRTDKNNLYNLRSVIDSPFNNSYRDRIIYTEDIGIDPNPFCVSLHLYIACLAKLGYERIVLFGADGGGIEGNNIASYYKSEEILEDKKIADNLSYNMTGDTNNVNTTYDIMMNKVLGYIPNVINCSPITRYTCFPIKTYDETLNILRQ